MTRRTSKASAVHAIQRTDLKIDSELNIGDVACLVCEGAANNIEDIAFVCRTAEGWSAGLSEDSLNQSSEESLTMVHISHLRNVPGLGRTAESLPVNVCLRRSHEIWKYEYFDASGEYEEGDFVAAPKDSALRGDVCNQSVYIFVDPSGNTLVVDLDDELQILPFWTSLENTQVFLEHAPETYKPKKDTLCEVKLAAVAQSLNFLAADFLIGAYDVAILAND